MFRYEAAHLFIQFHYIFRSGTLCAVQSNQCGSVLPSRSLCRIMGVHMQRLS